MDKRCTVENEIHSLSPKHFGGPTVSKGTKVVHSRQMKEKYITNFGEIELQHLARGRRKNESTGIQYVTVPILILYRLPLQVLHTVSLSLTLHYSLIQGARGFPRFDTDSAGSATSQAVRTRHLRRENCLKVTLKQTCRRLSHSYHANRNRGKGLLRGSCVG